MRTLEGPAGGVDVHSHVYPAAYLELVRQLLDKPGQVGAAARETVTHPLIISDPAFTEAGDERVLMLDEAGLLGQILSFSSPNLWTDDAGLRTELCSVFTAACSGYAERHSGRYAVFAPMPLPHVEATLAATEQAHAAAHVAGVSTCTHIAGRPLTDVQFRPVLEEWDRLSMTVFLHPDGFCAPGVLAEHGLDWSIGAPLDDTIAAARLISSGLLRRFPRITWIIPHLGGALPMLLERMDLLWRFWPPCADALDVPPSSALGGLLVDTVSPSPGAVRLACDVLGADRLVLGSDYPYACRQDLLRPLQIMQEAGLSAEQVGAITTAGRRWLCG